MEVKRVPLPALPPATYEITGLSLDEAVFLRDLMGKFPLSYNSRGPKGFPSDLYKKLHNLTYPVEAVHEFNMESGGILRVNGYSG